MKKHLLSNSTLSSKLNDLNDLRAATCILAVAWEFQKHAKVGSGESTGLELTMTMTDIISLLFHFFTFHLVIVWIINRDELFGKMAFPAEKLEVPRF